MLRICFYFLLFTLLFALPQRVHSQYFEQEINQALDTDPRFIAYLDSRGAFISTNGVRVFGVKAGLQYAEKLTFGIGYNQLATDYKNTIIEKGVETDVELNYWFFSPFVDYTFYRDKQWELIIPVQLGIGESYYTSDGDVLRFSWVFSYEPAIAFQYRFLEVFGAGFGVGYRLMVYPNRELEERFTSPVYMIKFKVYFDDLMEKLKQS